MAIRAPRKRATAGNPTQNNLVVFEANNFLGGLHYDLPAHKIPDNAVADSLNVIFDDGSISRRSGLQDFAYLPPGSPIRWIDEFYDKTGDLWMIFVTDSKMYVYNATDNGWNDVTPTEGLFGGVAYPVTGVGFYGYYFVTNDVDPPFYWQPGMANALNLTGTGAPLRATCVAAFFNHLMWFNVDDPNLGFQPQQVTWSDNQNGLVYNDGDAAVAQLEDTNDYITSCEMIFSYLCVARNKSIYVCEYIGYPYFYAFFRRVEKDGILATKSFRKNAFNIMGLSRENIISFDSSTETPFVGEPIKKDLFSKIIDPIAYTNVLGSPHAAFDQVAQKYRFFVSHRIDGEPDTEYAYSVKFQNWSKHQYAFPITALGSADVQSYLYWDVATRTWQSATVEWRNPSTSPLSPNMFYGDITGEVYSTLGNDYTDNGIGMPAWFVSKAYEFHHPDWIKELQRIQFIMSGSTKATFTVNVYSSDDGYNFNEAPASPVIMDGSQNPMPYVDVFCTGQWFQIMVTNNNPGQYFEIWNIRFSYEPLFRRTIA